MDLHNGHNGVQFKCYSCDKAYSRMDLLDFHCYLCDKSFQNKDQKRKILYTQGASTKEQAG